MPNGPTKNHLDIMYHTYIQGIKKLRIRLLIVTYRDSSWFIVIYNHCLALRISDSHQTYLRHQCCSEQILESLCDHACDLYYSTDGDEVKRRLPLDPTRLDIVRSPYVFFHLSSARSRRALGVGRDWALPDAARRVAEQLNSVLARILIGNRCIV